MASYTETSALKFIDTWVRERLATIAGVTVAPVFNEPSGTGTTLSCGVRMVTYDDDSETYGRPFGGTADVSVIAVVNAVARGEGALVAGETARKVRAAMQIKANEIDRNDDGTFITTIMACKVRAHDGYIDTADTKVKIGIDVEINFTESWK